MFTLVKFEDGIYYVCCRPILLWTKVFQKRNTVINVNIQRLL